MIVVEFTTDIDTEVFYKIVHREDRSCAQLPIFCENINGYMLAAALQLETQLCVDWISE
jgi:hypothetical protein